MYMYALHCILHLFTFYYQNKNQGITLNYDKLMVNLKDGYKISFHEIDSIIKKELTISIYNQQPLF
jgi:hypothetical protein